MNRVIKRLAGFVAVLGMLMTTLIVLAPAASATPPQDWSNSKVENLAGSPVSISDEWGKDDNAKLYEKGTKGKKWESTSYFGSTEGFYSHDDGRCVKVTGKRYKDGYYKIKANTWYHIPAKNAYISVRTYNTTCRNKDYFSYGMK